MTSLFHASAALLQKITPATSRFTVSVVLIGSFAISGCSKEEEAPATPPVTEAQPPAGPAPGVPAPQVATQPRTLQVSENANNEEVLQQMNRELLKWIVGHRRAPKSFEEFVSSAQLTVPPPPPGKKYVIGKDMKIVLK